MQDIISSLLETIVEVFVDVLRSGHWTRVRSIVFVVLALLAVLGGILLCSTLI